MASNKKILNELRSLQAFGDQVKEKATTLIRLMEIGEEVTASPKTIKRRAIVSKAVNDRNKKLKRAI